MKRVAMGRIIGAAMIFAAMFASPVRAASPFSNDVSDLWWNESESGWGVNLIQQGNTLFATFFIYDATGQPHWYVASNMTGAQVPSDRPYEFTGPLYETSGPVFSAASFNAATVTHRQVGTASFEFVPTNSGNLAYTIDGTTVTKHVTRQTWAANTFTGVYSGGLVTRISALATNCTAKTGTQLFDSITVSQPSSNAVTITALLNGVPPAEQCNYTGTYSQAGHMGGVSGTYSCSSGSNGTFILSELEIGVHGFAGFYSANDRGCAVYGNFAGVRGQ